MIRASGVSVFDRVTPDPAALTESLRAFGYSLRTAISDLIDNSLTASARNIWLSFRWNGTDSSIAIRDDGCGMSQSELINAMRLGSQNPQVERLPKDLGRFGLGLKTASFSQCRSVTVASKQSGGLMVVRRWDLDHVQAVADWQLLHGTAPGSEHLASELASQDSGTLVLWEKLDRVVGEADVDDRTAQDHFLEGVDRVRAHVGMVFHRFFLGPHRIVLWINEVEITPWDPFLRGERATQDLGMELLPYKGKVIEVHPYVLPHHSKLVERVHKTAAGPRGWNAHQGFFVYRNGRLLVDGDWLGLGFRQEEHYKLARIQLDIPNSLDQEWKIDVRKSIAVPPDGLKRDLKRIAEATRRKAVEIYRHRGKAIERTHSRGEELVWLRKVKHGTVFYSINRKHPLVKAALDPATVNRRTLNALLKLVEETVPVSTITIDSAESPDQQHLPFEGAQAELTDVAREVYRYLVASGVTSVEARRRIAGMEPFHHFPEILAVLAEEFAEVEQ